MMDKVARIGLVILCVLFVLSTYWQSRMNTELTKTIISLHELVGVHKRRSEQLECIRENIDKGITRILYRVASDLYGTEFEIPEGIKADVVFDAEEAKERE